MERKIEPVSLSNLAMGAAVERFNHELQNVIENILDPNTTLDKREITLKVTLKPDQNREACMVDISCKSKTAQFASHVTRVFVGADANGEPKAFESDPRQMNMFGDEEEKPHNVTELAERDGTNND